MEFDKQQDAIRALVADVHKREEVCLLTLHPWGEHLGSRQTFEKGLGTQESGVPPGCRLPNIRISTSITHKVLFPCAFGCTALPGGAQSSQVSPVPGSA